MTSLAALALLTVLAAPADLPAAPTADPAAASLEATDDVAAAPEDPLSAVLTGDELARLTPATCVHGEQRFVPLGGCCPYGGDKMQPQECVHGQWVDIPTLFCPPSPQCPISP